MENPTQYIRKYSDKFIFREDIWRLTFDHVLTHICMLHSL